MAFELQLADFTKISIMIQRIITITLTASLIGCATFEMPPGQENQKEFSQMTTLSYKEAYQIIAKQTRACDRKIAAFGNGFHVRDDLDTANQIGRVELYRVDLKEVVGITGATKPEDSMFSRTVTVKARDSGAEVTTTGTNPKYVYASHLRAISWLAGSESCLMGNQVK
jgi:hypothetical protein